MEVYAFWAEDGTLAGFKNRGGRFKEEEGFLGTDIVELFYMVSSGASAGGFKSILGADSGERLGEMEGERSIRIVSSDADNFAAINRDIRKGHLDRTSIECLRCKFSKWLLEMEDFVVSFHRGKSVPHQILASITITIAFRLHLSIGLCRETQCKSSA